MSKKKKKKWNREEFEAQRRSEAVLWLTTSGGMYRKHIVRRYRKHFCISTKWALKDLVALGVMGGEYGRAYYLEKQKWLKNMKDYRKARYLLMDELTDLFYDEYRHQTEEDESDEYISNMDTVEKRRYEIACSMSMEEWLDFCSLMENEPSE